MTGQYDYDLLLTDWNETETQPFLWAELISAGSGMRVFLLHSV